MQREETSQSLGKQFKIAVMLFVLFGLLFAVMDSQLAHIFDLTGLSGKEPQVKEAKEGGERLPDGRRKPPPAQKKPGEFSTQDPWRQPLDVIPASKPLTIDGLIKDWIMTRGIFMTPDYKMQASTSSLWYHFMYDQQYLYVLVRCRGWDQYANESLNGDDTPRDYCIQIQVHGQDPLAFNYYGNPKEKDVVKRQSFAGKGETTDAIAAGLIAATTRQPDARGIDVEMAIPWKLISTAGFKGNPSPRPGQRMPICVAARLGRKQILGKPAENKLDPRFMAQATFLPAAPSRPLPIVMRKGKQFFVRIKDGRVAVDWDTPVPALRTESPTLLVRNDVSVTLDGKTDDWCLNSGLVASSDLRRMAQGCFRLHAASDGKKLYLLAMVNDITPSSPGDMLVLRLQTDRRHEIKLTTDEITVDGKASPAGAALKRHIRPDGTGYVLEASMSWSMLGGVPSGPVPITCRAQLNPHWVFTDLTSVPAQLFDYDDHATWGRTRFFSGRLEKPVYARILDGGLPVEVMEDGQVRVNSREGTRSAYGTDHGEVKVFSGSAKIDGQADDWDLRSGIYSCDDLRRWYGRVGAWLHAKYDEKGMYFLVRVDDPTPLQRAAGSKAPEDNVILRFASDRLLKILLAFDEKGQPLVDVGFAGGLKERLMKMKPDEHGIKMAFARRETGDGYTHEIFIPWKTIRADGKSRKSNDAIMFVLEYHTGAGMGVIDITKAGVKRNGITRDVLHWGEARFLPVGATAKLAPCPLRNGMQVPVKMKDGKPGLDLSVLR